MKSCLTTIDLYYKMPDRLLNTQAVKNRKLDRKELAAEIFNRLFYRILLDILENNITFVLPLNFGNYGEWHVRQVSGEEYKRRLAKGRWKDIDFLAAGFVGNIFVYNYKGKNQNARECIASLTGVGKQILKENTLKQKQYY